MSNDEGTPCRFCGTTALACQHIFRGSIDHGLWCCPSCRVNGAWLSHAPVAPPEEMT